jgi:hypothetical protein
MSKRVSNKKGKSRKTQARSRVRFGWKKRELKKAVEKIL